jgi:hypothetical protein
MINVIIDNDEVRIDKHTCHYVVFVKFYDSRDIHRIRRIDKVFTMNDAMQVAIDHTMLFDAIMYDL